MAVWAGCFGSKPVECLSGGVGGARLGKSGCGDGELYVPLALALMPGLGLGLGLVVRAFNTDG